jgi:hypothetical protein
MGTYITIDGYIQFKTENRPKILQALKDLNKIDEAKRGGSFGSDKRLLWFSWMPEKYDEEVKSVEDVFNLLLEHTVTESYGSDEEIIRFNYNNKWGQHEIFFFAIAPYLTDMRIDHHCDELNFEDSQWSIVLDKKNKTAHTLYPEITIKYPEISPDNISTVDDYIDLMRKVWS